MRKFVIPFLVFLMFFSSVASLVSQQTTAEQGQQGQGDLPEGAKPLINFSTLATDASGTTVDFSQFIQESVPAEMVEGLSLDLSLKNWTVELSSSANSIEYSRRSFVRPATVSANAARFAGEDVLGIRVNFPKGRATFATLTPPFDIPFVSVSATADEQAGDSADAPAPAPFEGLGVVSNLDNIKEVSMTIFSEGYPHRIDLVMEGINGEEYTFPMGSLAFYGWKTFVWSNPEYIERLDRLSFAKVTPRYPATSNVFRFKKIVIHHPASYDRGDLVFYIRDVNVLGDSSLQGQDSDIPNENIWRIQEARAKRRDLKGLREIAYTLYRHQKDASRKARGSFVPPSPADVDLAPAEEASSTGQ